MPADRSLLQYASVLGQTFTLEGLQAVTGQGDDLEAAPPRPRPPRAADPRHRPALAGARPVRLRAGAGPRRRLRHADEARPQGGAPRRRRALRVAPGRRDHRRHRGALPRRVSQRARRPRRRADPRARGRAAAARRRARHGARLARAGGPLPGAGARGHAGAGAPVAAAAPDRRRGRVARASTTWPRAILRRALAAAREGGHQPSEALALASLGRLLASGSQPAIAITEITAGLAGARRGSRRSAASWPCGRHSRAPTCSTRRRSAAVEWADRALPLAERLDMLPEITDLLNTRATALAFGGRVREGVAGLRGVLDMTLSYGLPIRDHPRPNQPQQRAEHRGPDGRLADRNRRIRRCQAQRQPRHDDGDGRRTHRQRHPPGRVGQRSRDPGGAGCHRAGTARPILRGLHHERARRPAWTALRRLARASRGVRAHHRRAHRWSGRSSRPGPGWRCSPASYGEAFDESWANVAVNRSNASDDLPVAARAALWAGRRRRREEGGRSSSPRSASMGGPSTPACGRSRVAWRRIGGHHAGSVGGLSRCDPPVARPRALAFDLALCELDFVKFVGGENPDAKAAADEAEGIFRRLGAPAFLRRLNDAVGLPTALAGGAWIGARRSRSEPALATTRHRQDLGDDGVRHLLRPLRADVQARRRVELLDRLRRVRSRPASARCGPRGPSTPR